MVENSIMRIGVQGGTVNTLRYFLEAYNSAELRLSTTAC